MAKGKLGKRDFQTLSNFRYQLRRFLAFSEGAARSNGVTPLQYLLLLHVKGTPERDWATIKELAEKLQTHHHGVVSLVDRCAALDLVTRHKGEGDRREVEVHLTAKGEAIVHAVALLHRDELVSRQGVFRVPGAQDLPED